VCVQNMLTIDVWKHNKRRYDAEIQYNSDTRTYKIHSYKQEIKDESLHKEIEEDIKVLSVFLIFPLDRHQADNNDNLWQSEFSKYGHVEEILIPKPDPTGVVIKPKHTTTTKSTKPRTTNTTQTGATTIHTYTYIHMCTYTHTHTHMYVYTHVHVHVYTYHVASVTYKHWPWIHFFRRMVWRWFSAEQQRDHLEDPPP
jgi:hypothetical protein